MEHNEVDVTHTVKASEADGRLLLKNVDTGETRWLSQVSSEPVPPEDPKLDGEVKLPLPVIPANLEPVPEVAIDVPLPTLPEEVEKAIAAMKKKRGPSRQD